MARTAALTSIIVLVSVVGVLAARTAAQKADFAPALAAEVTAGSSALIAPENVIVAGVAGDVFADFLDATAGSSGAQAPSEAAAVAETQTAPETVAPHTVVAPAAAVAPAWTPAPQPVRTAAPAVAPAPAAPAPTTCPASWFCYPRLGISGPIVPYTDCSGSTDVGTAIRSYNCLSDHYLMAHAYTQFGLVRQWVAGDVVFAWGQRFTVSGAITQQSCGAPSFPLATLSMQTSLTSSACGPVLVVQAR
jgi:hypothetical protein